MVDPKPNPYQEALDDLEASSPWSFDPGSFALGVVSLLVLLVALRVLRRHMERRKAARALKGFYESHGVK